MSFLYRFLFLAFAIFSSTALAETLTRVQLPEDSVEARSLVESTFKSVFGVSADTGTVVAGEYCTVDYQFRHSGASRSLSLTVKDSRLAKPGYNWIGWSVDYSQFFALVDEQGVRRGFVNERNVGFDCETQGCLYYETKILRIDPQGIVADIYPVGSYDYTRVRCEL